MTVIAHIADLHLGHRHLGHLTADGRRNLREDDFERAALAVVEHLIAERVDLVVVAGDLLDKTAVSTTALDGALELASRLQQAGIPLVIVGGNHDQAESDTSTSDLVLLRRFGAHLALAQEQLDLRVGGQMLRLHLVPFRALSRAQRGSSELTDFAFASDWPNILVAHGYAEGPDIPSNPLGEEVEVPAEWLREPRFALCCLGHIHRHTQLTDTAFFSGSTERRNFGERAETPGLWLHTLDEAGQLSSQSVLVCDLNPALPRPMAQFELDADGLTTDELDARVRALLDTDASYGAMVRLVLRGVSAELDRRGLQRAWQALFSERGGLELDLVTQTKEVAELLDVEFAAAPTSLDEAFAEFVAGQDYADDADKAAMGRLAAQVMADAHEKLLKVDGE